MPIKQLFLDPVSGYRILACELVEPNINIKLNKYRNFIISGDNINYQLKQPIILDIEPKKNTKYENEYICMGYGGIEINHDEKNITVDSEQERAILQQFMTRNQANNVLKAYPNFVELILNNKRNEIDIRKIHNVGNYRFNDYVNKIETNCDRILFNKKCWEIGIVRNADIEKIQKKYKKIDLFINHFKQNPYESLCSTLGFSFDKANQIVLKNFPFLKDNKDRCKYLCLDILKGNENNGDTKINPYIIARYVKENLPELVPYVVDVIKNDKDIYYDKATKFCSLSSTRLQEENIAEYIKYCLKRSGDDTEYDRDFVEQFRKIGNISLTDEQMRILEIMDKGWIAVLTGNAGCGKTASLKALVQMFEAKKKSYSILTPTGISAKVVKQATGRMAQTIHMTLARRYFVGEYIIIEEASMVTVELLSDLFNYIDKDHKIIFVCDENQLPSIGAGNIVHDIIASGVVPVARLTKTFRYNSSGIITNVTDVRNGNFDHFNGNYSDFSYTEATSNIEEQLLNQYQHYLDMGYNKDDILILSPFRITKTGSHAINNIIQAKYNHHPYSEAKIKVDGFNINFKIGDRVINTKNDYHMPKWDIDNNSYEFYEDKDGNKHHTEIPIYNGDLGNIIDIKTNEEGRARIVVKWEDGIGCVEGPKINNLLLGYCVSIFKSQGAQNKAIIVVINNKGRDEFINRNLLYVALSRAQEHLSIIANKEIIEEGLEYQANLTRETWLEEMLNE